MFAPPPSRWCPRPSLLGALRALTWFGLASLSASCEWVMGGIPSKPELDGSTLSQDIPDGATDHTTRPEDAAPDTERAGGDGSERADASANVPHPRTDAGQPDDAGAVPAEVPAENDAASARDGGPASDADVPVGSDDAGSERGDAGTTTCAAPIAWYPDQDGDGYGRAAAPTLNCTRPSGAWASRADDCDDEQPAVFPGQPAYFDTAYQTASGGDSFDYDCSGSEEGNDLQKQAPDNCGLLAVTACDSTGYAKTARSGLNANSYCGSKVQTTCMAALLGALICSATSTPIDEPYRCH